MALPTVGALCRALGEHLQPAAGFEATETPITAVHVSELTDPTAYVNGGELLLTTGLTLPTSLIGWEEYVGRLTRIGIAALGVGLGPKYAELPTALVAACRTQGLPLLVVPAPTPFLTITAAYWSARSRSTEQPLQDAFATQRALVDAAVSHDPAGEILKRLARTAGGWAARLSATGTVEEIFPAGLVEEAEALQNEVRRLEVAGVHSAASFVAHDRYVALFPLTVRDAIVGYLAVGTPAQLSGLERRLVMTAVALLSIDALHRRRSASEHRAHARAVAGLVDLGHVDAARRLAATLGLPAPGREARVLVVAGRDGDRLARAVEQWCPGVLGVASGRTRAWFLLPTTHPPTAELDAALAAADPTAAALLSELTRLEDVGPTRTRLEDALTRVPPGRLTQQQEGPVADPDLGRALEELVDRQGEQTVAALVAYLRHRGQWEQAARSLGVHRNTLRYRVGRAREVAGLDLDDPDVAARLWLVMRARGIA